MPDQQTLPWKSSPRLLTCPRITLPVFLFGSDFPRTSPPLKARRGGRTWWWRPRRWRWPGACCGAGTGSPARRSTGRRRCTWLHPAPSGSIRLHPAPSGSIPRFGSGNVEGACQFPSWCVWYLLRALGVWISPLCFLDTFAAFRCSFLFFFVSKVSQVWFPFAFVAELGQAPLLCAFREPCFQSFLGSIVFFFFFQGTRSHFDWYTMRLPPPPKRAACLPIPISTTRKDTLKIQCDLTS